MEKHRPTPTAKKPKSKKDKAFERFLMIIGGLLLAAFLLGTVVGAVIANAVNKTETAEADGVLTALVFMTPCPFAGTY